MEETDRGYLTEEELQTVANTVFVDKQTNLVRDMFLFGCFTGLSYLCGGKYSPFLKKATVCTSSGDSIPVPIQSNTLRIAFQFPYQHPFCPATFILSFLCLYHSDTHSFRFSGLYFLAHRFYPTVSRNRPVVNSRHRMTN